MSPVRHSRRGEGIVDHLLVLTVAFFAVLVAAWVWMPDTRQAFATLVAEGLSAVGFETIPPPE